VYSVADLHGDFGRFKLILSGLGLASFDARGIATWTGNSSILVSTGDSVDRGKRSRPIYDAFRKLHKEAAKTGGEVVNVLGNHDLMNVQDDLRYVPEEENQPSGDFGSADARAKEWSPGGSIGKDVRSRFVAAAVRGGSVFVHAGLHPKWLRNRGNDPVSELNADVRKLLQPAVVSRYEEVFKSEGPFWIREFAMGKSEKKVCELVAETLQLAGAKRMVVGHTIQDGGIQTRCKSEHGPQLLLSDTAISRAYGPHGVPSAVEYLPSGAVTAIYFGNPDENVAAMTAGKGPTPEIQRKVIFAPVGGGHGEL
jgi:hypothetical protein